MKYELRWISTDGKSGRWTGPFATRQEAEEHAALRQMANGLSYTVEEVADVPPKPKSTSTTERLVRLLHDRHARGLAKYGTTLDRTDLAPGEWAQHAIEEALDLAGYLMRLKDSLAASPQGTAKASEAPGEGGDSDRRRLAVLNDWIRGGHRAFGFQNGIVVGLDGLCLRPVVEAPTLAAIADKLMEKESKP